MRKIILSSFIFLYFLFASPVGAVTLTELIIESQDHSLVRYQQTLVEDIWRWDTIPDSQTPFSFSAIGVSLTLENPTTINNPDTTIHVPLNYGESIYLFTESFPSLEGLFRDEPYNLMIVADGQNYTLEFGFGNSYGEFIPQSTTSPFALSFLGFTNPSDIRNINIGDLVGPGDSLTSDGSPDAVYKLTYNVPEPTTVLLLGAGLIVIVGLSRKKFFKK